jgi:hypothetical protein
VHSKFSVYQGNQLYHELPGAGILPDASCQAGTSTLFNR